MPGEAGPSRKRLHRMDAVARRELDPLPPHGTVVTLLSIRKLRHRQGDPEIVMVAVSDPLVALAIVLLIATRLGAY